ncbi:MAG: DNA primase [Methanobacterium sp.]|nr:DNA primase [Methanobacterium sp.]
MVSVAFINPFSEEGRQIVRELGDLNSVYEENGDLIDLVIHSRSQDISDDESIPHNLIDLAIKRLEWYIKKKNNPDFDYKKYSYLYNPKITRFDVIAFYLLSQAISVKFGPNSRESRAMAESQGKLMESRLGELSLRDRKHLLSTILGSLLIGDVKWTTLGDLLSSRKIRLPDLVMSHGNLILDEEEFAESFQDKLENRDSHKMYELLIGDHIKELILNKMIMQKTENYITDVYKKSQRKVEPNPILLDLADRISEVLNEPIISYGYRGTEKKMEASPFDTEAFPPCVKMVLDGIKSGGRNDAIILFLTPFLSYARLYPDVFRRNITLKVSDVDPQLEAVEKEILPLIYEAAERCTPPLFEDQPQEKVNINAKMGFGMHSEIELKHEGETTWYTPMGCEKVKLHLPSLCKPDEICKKIGNPLSYYIRRLNDIKYSKNSKTD